MHQDSFDKTETMGCQKTGGKNFKNLLKLFDGTFRESTMTVNRLEYAVLNEVVGEMV